MLSDHQWQSRVAQRCGATAWYMDATGLAYHELMAEWSPDSLTALANRFAWTLSPPIMPSLKLYLHVIIQHPELKVYIVPSQFRDLGRNNDDVGAYIARGPLNTTFPAISVRPLFAWKYADACADSIAGIQLVRVRSG